MSTDMQNLINEISESKIKANKTSKKQLKAEKEYNKAIIFNKKSKNPNISNSEISMNLGISIEEVEEALKELAEIKKIESNPPAKKESFKKTKEKIKKIKRSSKKLLDKDDKKTILDIFLKILVFGVPINFSLWCFVYHPFTFYSWISYGYVFWLIKKELVVLLRSLWFR